MRSKNDAKHNPPTNVAESERLSAGVSGRKRPKFRRDAFLSWLGSGFGSLVLHALAVLLLFFAIRESSRPGGPRGRRTDAIGIVLSDADDKDAGGGSQGAPSNETATDAPDVVQKSTRKPSETPVESPDDWKNVAESLLPPEPSVGLTSRTSAPSSSSSVAGANGAISPSDFGRGGAAGNGIGAGRGEGQNVGFGEVRGTGRKFVYVLDRSDSMSWRGGAPMNRAISEAIASVESLDPKRGATKFQLVYFNHEPKVFEDGRALLDVDPANKARVVRFLRSISPTGGTAPEKALAVALKMRPDVVFLLTDADEELSEATLAEIQEARRRNKTKQICVVEFGKKSDSPKTSFRRLAGENNGAYIFKDVDSL